MLIRYGRLHGKTKSDLYDLPESFERFGLYRGVGAKVPFPYFQDPSPGVFRRPFQRDQAGFPNTQDSIIRYNKHFRKYPSLNDRPEILSLNRGEPERQRLLAVKNRPVRVQKNNRSSSLPDPSGFCSPSGAYSYSTAFSGGSLVHPRLAYKPGAAPDRRPLRGLKTARNSILLKSFKCEDEEIKVVSSVHQ
jgi:hypothetical protein